MMIYEMKLEKGSRFVIEGMMYEFDHDLVLNVEYQDYFLDGKKIDLKDYAHIVGKFDMESYYAKCAAKGFFFNGGIGTIFLSKEMKEL